MKFKVAARTVLELGAELISSDAIAIYELVKNAFDAQSPNVDVTFSILFSRTTYSEIEDAIEAGRIETVQEAISELKQGLKRPATDQRVRRALERLEVRSLDEFRRRLKRLYVESNEIKVEDTGVGMSSDDLEDAFLTIGTANRVVNRAQGDRPMLGEKGVGRLSSMRLGSLLEVRSTRAGERCVSAWNKDPVFGVIGIQSGPRDKGPQWLPSSHRAGPANSDSSLSGFSA